MLRISLIVALSLAAAGCGAASNASTTPGGAASGGHGSPVAFARCMRANGVPNFPDPQGGGIKLQASQTAGSGESLTVNGVPINAPAFRSAQAKCQKYMPNGGRVSAAQLAKLRAGALAMARCMRSHGVPNFPDPQVEAGPGGGMGMRVRVGPGAGIDPRSPAFQAAQKACQRFMALGGDTRSSAGVASAG